MMVEAATGHKGIAMGFLDSLTWQVLGGGASQVALYNAIMDMIGRHPGGLAGVVAQFNEAGLGELMGSWIGTGANTATKEQIRTGLGETAVQGIAMQTGLTDDAALTRLATLLPRLIDTLTPNGVVPAIGPAPNRLTFLAGLAL
ncbi:MAG: DUF937 domain-containing protein [Ignavibacteriae bacterium]|nr:DUF937 domain-containing protein [Ignavibacteriota bacterium]